MKPIGSASGGRPPFRADHVGSLLRPPALKAARAAYAAGRLDHAALTAVEDREIERVVRKQEAIGLTGVTDGEFRRSWWHLDFLWGLDGVAKHVLDTGVAFAAAATRREGVRVDGKIGFSTHPMVAHFEFLRACVRRVPKVTIPAPSALYGRPARLPVDAAVYPRLDELFHDLGLAYRAAVRAFADAGCRYLQLDEVFLAMLCDPNVSRADDGARRRSREARGLVCAAHQHRDRRHSGRHDRDAAFVPRQLQVDVHGLGRL